MHSTNRQLLPPVSLWLVATPIGNLGDVSSRAREVLKQVDAILCEDTRHSLKLLNHLSISKPLHRMDANVGEGRIKRVIDDMQEGKVFAFVSDAGTPTVSDPGASLVRIARKAGLKVSAVPGPSAVTTFLSLSGLIYDAFSFHGFFPRSFDEQKKMIQGLLQQARSANEVQVWVWFESPKRLGKTLSGLLTLNLAGELVVGKELTKIHEKIFTGTIADVVREVQTELDEQGERGEWCFALSPEEKVLEKNETNEPAREILQKVLLCLKQADVSASDAARIVSQSFGVAKKDIYSLAVETFSKKNS